MYIDFMPFEIPSFHSLILQQIKKKSIVFIIYFIKRVRFKFTFLFPLSHSPSLFIIYENIAQII